MRRWWRSAARVLFRRNQVEQDLDDEMQEFVDELVRRRVNQGIPAEDARRQVLAEAGSIGAVKDGIRDAVMETCCGLHNFRLQYRPWQYAL